MEQPPNPNRAAATSALLPSTDIKKEEEEEDPPPPPTPEEILAAYYDESEGLETREASLRAISDIQSLFFRAVGSATNANKRRMKEGKKIENINTRLSLLEMKIDAKPGFSQSFTIGLASASVLSLTSHLATIWRSVTKSHWH